MTPAEIVSAVSASFGVEVRAITGPARSRYITSARREAARQLYDLGLSYTEVGRVINRDHTSVLYLLGRTAAARA